jgi:hypothetical protein
MQANAEGDLSQRARRRAEALANDADLRMKPPKGRVPAAAGGGSVTGRVAPSRDPRVPMPGTVLTRPYKGKTVQVTVLRDGFECDGAVYGSLSAVAKAVTGSHWNGWHFFGLAGGKEGTS